MANDPLRVVLAGCGNICATWLPHIIAHPGLRLVALVDLNPENARRRAQEFGLAEILLETDLDRALTGAAADVVFDCTVPAAHHEVAMTALRHGCHVLSEKPLADSMQSAQEMVVAARAAGRIHAVIQNRRYSAEIRRLRAFLDSGVLGPITTVCCDFFKAIYPGGFRQEMDHVLLLDMAIHSFDEARFLLGGSAARTVLCQEWNPPGSWFRHGAAAGAIFEMEGGATFMYRGSWSAEGLPTSWEGSWRIVGEKGSVTWDGEQAFQAQVADGPEGFTRPQRVVDVPETNFPAQSERHRSIIHEFVNAVRHKTIPETVSSDNILSLAMVFSAIESATRGTRVNLEPRSAKDEA